MTLCGYSEVTKARTRTESRKWLNLRSCLQKENWNVSTCLCLYHLHQHISTLHHSIVAYCTTIVYNHCVPLLCTFTLVFHYWTALVSDSVPTCRPTNQRWDRKRFTFDEQRCDRGSDWTKIDCKKSTLGGLWSESNCKSSSRSQVCQLYSNIARIANAVQCHN